MRNFPSPYNVTKLSPLTTARPGRLLKQFSDTQDITFHFARGYLDSQPPPGLAEQLEGPPHLRFFQWDSAILDLFDINYATHVQKYGPLNLAKGRDIPARDASEEEKNKQPSEDDTDTPSRFGDSIMAVAPEPWSVALALEYLHNIIEDEGPFHGVIGVSEGASVAATLLVEDIQRCKAEGTKSQLRCGLFYIGAPAWKADGSRAVLGYTDGHVIDVPTCHVLGSKDVLREGAELLLGICERERALVISDEGGHRIPQDMETNELIAGWIREQERALVGE